MHIYGQYIYITNKIKCHFNLFLPKKKKKKKKKFFLLFPPQKKKKKKKKELMKFN